MNSSKKLIFENESAEGLLYSLSTTSFKQMLYNILISYQDYSMYAHGYVYTPTQIG